MSVTFRILPARGLVYVRYDGFASVEDSGRIFAEYLQHPDFRPGQKQLVDLAGVTEVEHDFPRLFELQAQKAAAFLPSGVQTLIVYHAPSPVSYDMARLITRSWEGIDGVVPRVVEDEAQALEILGLGATRFTDLFQTTA